MADARPTIEVRGAREHNLKNIDISIDRGAITVITGVSGSGKSSLAFDTVLAESQRRFFYTLSHYSRQFLDLTARPAVRTISGLSPAIALAQNETPPSKRATVGSLTDLSELFGVVFARFGDQHCPLHGLPTAGLSTDEMVERIFESRLGETVVLTAPVAEGKKGTFKSALAGFAERGFLKALVDGELASLAPVPTLARESKHTIKVVIDYVKVKPDGRARLKRSLEIALTEGQGYAEIYVAGVGGAISIDKSTNLSQAGGCPKCGYSWPRLDARYFSPNSLGRCEECNGLGTVFGDEHEEESNAEAKVKAGNEIGQLPSCVTCNGTGLAAKMNAIRLGDLSPQQVHALPLDDLAAKLAQVLNAKYKHNAAFVRLATEISSILERCRDIGLGYLAMGRRIQGLSGGEAQRLKLAGILSENLRGVLYVLDEPSQGLHPSEIDHLLRALNRLKNSGNTILVVDHDEAVMRGADWIVDLGPGGGARGGHVMAKFRPREAGTFAKESSTARYLSLGADTSKRQTLKPRVDPVHSLLIEGASLNNLKIKRVHFPRGALTVVTGPSGAGKSSLALKTLVPNVMRQLGGKGKLPGPVHCRGFAGADGIESVSLVDRRPIAKSSVSMPASYLDVFGEIRDLFANLPDAQVLGLTARSFSLSVDAGRCVECKGRGELSLSMRFLADARIPCAVCKGKRYQSNVLGVRYLGLSISEVLDQTISESAETFKHHRKILQRLEPAIALGLGYLRLGQPSASLSGGEAQRLKLVPEVTRGTRSGPGQLIVLDEPTTGLHFEDVDRLIHVIETLVGRGATVVAIEHNQDFINAADWRVDLGPGAAALGGQLVAEGPPRVI